VSKQWGIFQLHVAAVGIARGVARVVLEVAMVLVKVVVRAVVPAGGFMVRVKQCIRE